MRPLAYLLAAGVSLAAFAQAQAGQRFVQGEGRAVLAGKDLSTARNAALADALYDAASKIDSRVRGASLIDTDGALKEESSMLVAGRFSGYHVVFEGREGGAYIVRVEAVGVTDEEACSGKRVDLDIREIRTRVAPGVQGQVQRNVAEGLSRGIESLGEASGFRISDQRYLRQTRGDERTHRSQYDYMAQLTNSMPSPAGFSISGNVIVEMARRGGSDVSDLHAYLAARGADHGSGAASASASSVATALDRMSVSPDDVEEAQRILPATSTAGTLPFNQMALQRYILHCAQQTEGGGLRDKPGKSRDFYHTCYSLSGLAIAQHFTLDGVGGGGGLTDALPNVFGDPSNLVRPTSAVYNIGFDKLHFALNYFAGQVSTHAGLLG